MFVAIGSIHCSELNQSQNFFDNEIGLQWLRLNCFGKNILFIVDDFVQCHDHIIEAKDKVKAIVVLEVTASSQEQT